MDTATLEKLEHSDDGPATAKIYNYQKYLVSRSLTYDGKTLTGLRS